MSSTTENLGLTLPDVTDFYDVGVTNTNMSLIDAAVGQIADTGAKETSVQSIITKIGTTTDTGGTATTGTVMGKLNALQGGNWKEYVFSSTRDYPRIGSPVTMTINGSGELAVFKTALTPNSSSNLNRLTLSITVDNETILTHTVYHQTDTSSGGVARILFGVSTMGTVTPSTSSGQSTLTYKFDYVSPEGTYTNEILQQLFGTPIVRDMDNGSYYGLCMLSSPIKFNQNLTITISTEDFDNVDPAGFTCVYGLN